MLNYISSSEEFKRGQLVYIRRSLKKANIRASQQPPEEKIISLVKHPAYSQKNPLSENHSCNVSYEPTCKAEPELIWYEDVWEHYKQKQDLSKEIEFVKADIRAVKASRKGCCLFSCFQKRYPRLHPKAKNERNTILAIAKKGYQSAKGLNDKVLLGIYQKLTRSQETEFSKVNWEDLGFQNPKDPYTDLRALGMLGVVQILYLLENHSEVAKEIHKASLLPKNGFPFVLVSFDITKVAVQSLREGLLNGVINEKRYVMYVLNMFYMATFFAWFLDWRTNKLEMKDYFFCSKRIAEQAKDDPLKQIELLPNLVKSIL